MSHTGWIELGLLQSDGHPALAPETRIGIEDLITRQRFQTVTLSFPPLHRLEVPAFPQSQALLLSITTERYRPRTAGPISITQGETVVRRPTLWRLPNKWQASFVAFGMLPVTFDVFKRVMVRSPRIRMLKGASIGSLTDEAYDAVSVPKQVLAKAALLNLYLKLRLTPDPTTGNKSWFDHVEEIVEIDRERFIAKASPTFLDAVTAVRGNTSDFPDYKKTPSGDHFDGYPKGYEVRKSSIVSVKTREETGNLQLTAARAKDAEGNDVVLADIDIDENGKLLKHIADLFKHPFTGGTHPYDIHDFLKSQFGPEPLGYTLV
jgi:hypothetical protein